ncbi:MAG TPA: type I-C CRISPR-associated protein Cas8c/Csd1, partial [Planctomycetaceae bacterium]
QRHLEVEREIDDPAFSAVCRFLERWNPDHAATHEELAQVTGGFGVFRIAGTEGHVHDRPKVRDWWLGRLRSSDGAGERMQCLVTGEVAPIARIHEPKIKGVWGAQTAGALLVSYNFDATESYGKTQSYTGPVSEEAAFRYAVALNKLLEPGSRQKVQLGDATTVFWTEKPTPAEAIFGFVFESRQAEDPRLKLRVGHALKSLAEGRYPGEDLGDPETPFYVLGLSPNAARLSVRFWWQSTLGEVAGNVGRHVRDLAIVRPPNAPEFLTTFQLLRETAREAKDIPPLLSGGLARSVLTGTAYPQAFYAALVRRLRADREVSYVRAAAIKACLNRSVRLRDRDLPPDLRPLDKELPVSLDPDRPEPAYQLGRLFAALEKVQEEALPGLNDTIKDRYFGAASATPASVFPRLIRLSQHHLGKLDNRAYRLSHEKRLQEICGRLDGFPSHLSLRDQGLFAIGYYHQRQDFFTKKGRGEAPEAEATAGAA